MRDVPDDDGGERVRLYGQNTRALYFLTHCALAKGGSATVRYGTGVYACMTCAGAYESTDTKKASCEHTKMVREFWEWLTEDEQKQAIRGLDPVAFARETEPEPAAAATSPTVEAIEWLI